MDLRFVAGIDPRLIVVSRKQGPKEIRVRVGHASHSIVSTVICRSLTNSAEERLRKRSIKRKLPALLLSLAMSPFLPVAGQLGVDLMIVAASCGKPKDEHDDDYK